MSTEPLRLQNAPQVEAAFAAVPDTEVGEILDGELVVSPRPAGPHTSAASNLGGLLFDPFRRGRGGPGGWIVLDEPELHLGPRPDKLVPDLAGWRRTTLAEVPDAPAITVAPDWVCEVLSERTEHVDRGRKRRIYRREGVAYLWYLDPRERTLEVYQLVNERWHELETFVGDARVRAAPFDAIELELEALWAR